MNDLSLITDIVETGSHDLTSEDGILNMVGDMLGMEQADCPVTHHFCACIYMREVNISAGVFSIGHYQKKEHLNFMAEGEVLMFKDDGSVERVTAPRIFTSPPGRKVGLIIEDMKWFNIYPTTETDINVLESTYLDKAEIWGDSDFINKKLDYLVKHKDREDFESVEEVKLEGELIPFPSGSFKVQVSSSQIEGKGLFATGNFREGDLIAPVYLGGITPAGQYTNHSPNPNAEFVLVNNDVVLVALRDIEGCKGGELGEEITVDYRSTLRSEERRVGKEWK